MSSASITPTLDYLSRCLPRDMNWALIQGIGTGAYSPEMIPQFFEPDGVRLINNKLGYSHDMTVWMWRPLIGEEQRERIFVLIQENGKHGKWKTLRIWTNLDRSGKKKFLQISGSVGCFVSQEDRATSNLFCRCFYYGKDSVKDYPKFTPQKLKYREDAQHYLEDLKERLPYHLRASIWPLEDIRLGKGGGFLLNNLKLQQEKIEALRELQIL